MEKINTILNLLNIDIINRLATVLGIITLLGIPNNANQKNNIQLKSNEKIFEHINILIILALFFYLLHRFDYIITISRWYACLVLIGIIFIVFNIFNKPINENISKYELTAFGALITMTFISLYTKTNISRLLFWLNNANKIIFDISVILLFITIYGLVLFTIIIILIKLIKRIKKFFDFKNFSYKKILIKDISDEELIIYKELRKIEKITIKNFWKVIIYYLFDTFCILAEYILSVLYGIYNSIILIVVRMKNIINKNIIDKPDVLIINLSFKYSAIIATLVTYIITLYINIISQEGVNLLGFIASVIIIPVIISDIINIRLKAKELLK
jgi:hypothetical protein